MQHGLPEVGDVIAGKYTIECPLGRGGMGVVYVASHRGTGKRMAVKCLSPEFLEHKDIVERFMREAQAMGRIQHRHVVDVFDVGRDGDILFIVMELLEGKLLTDMLHDEAMTLEETLGILVRAMEGVEAAHRQNIIHRDLKPDNIFVCMGTSGRLDDPRVLDFGISKLDDENGQRLTRSGVAMGTPYYMSLEQMSANRDIDLRVDVYAMGVILYEAIAGQLPYAAESVSALAIHVLTTSALHLSHLRADLPEGLSAVVMKAIARDREQRYPTMQALIDAVRPYVPRGAGLLVPEGQGIPLRTPRGAPSAGPASDATLPAMTSALRAGPSLTPGAYPVLATPHMAPLASPATGTQASVRPKRVWVALTIGGMLLGLATLGYWMREAQPKAEQSKLPRTTQISNPPPLRPREEIPRAVAPLASPAVEPGPTGGRAATNDEAREGQGGQNDQTGQDGKASVSVVRMKQAEVKAPSKGAASRPAKATTPKAADAPQPAAKGRAGELTPDEF